MHILLLNQFFWPDTAPTGQLLADVTRLIDPKVHRITVFCGASDYGARDSTSSPPQVRIARLGNLGFSRGKVGRVVSYATFLMAAALRSLREPKADLVLTLTTPPLISLVGTLLKAVRGSHHFIWEMDVYPDIAVDLNVLKAKSLTARLVGMLADFSRRRADGIIALGQDMKGRLIARGIPEDKIFVAENWADGSEIMPSPFEEGPLVIHYSGTFGLAHEQQTICEAMRQLRNETRFRFLFSGGGARRQAIEGFCRSEKIHNVEFRPYTNRSDLSRSLAEGHLGLVTQVPQTMGAMVPSKIYGRHTWSDSTSPSTGTKSASVDLRRRPSTQRV
jgi:colanic acid biosynthesis glycosyl transferase WcaI